MELTIEIKYDGTSTSPINQDWEERIRILDIDGAYLVCVCVTSKISDRLISWTERAFGSLFEAEDFLKNDLGIDIPDDENKQEHWDESDYD